MAYCTQADIVKLLPEEELIQLTTESGVVPDAEVVAQAIAQADAEIDSYLAVRYVLPLAAPTPARVLALSVDMAIYHLYSRRSIMSEVRRDKYKEALAFLRDVAAGRAEIIGADGAEPSGESADVVEITSSERIFNRETTGGW